MNKKNNLFILAIGVLLLVLSYEYDSAISAFFRAVNVPILDPILRVVTNFAFVIAVMLMLPCAILYKKNKKILAYFAAAFIVSIIAAFIIKLIVLRQRPIQEFNFPFTQIVDYSFPSMHTMAAFALVPLLAYFFHKQKYYWLAFAVLVAFTRIYFGFHFLSDVIFGAAAGYFIGEFVISFHEDGKTK